MKKTIVALAVMMSAVTGFAYDKGEMYVSPVIGYHFFDEDHDMDDAAEVGLRFGKFLTNKYALELEGDIAPTEKDNGSDENAVTLSLNSVRYFEVSKYFSPYYFLGIGGMLYDDNHVGVLGGIGARYALNDKFSLDLRVKDMFMTKSRNDIVPSLALNYAFGKAAPAAVVVEPVKVEVKEPVKVEVKEPVKAAAVVEKKPVDTDGDGVYDELDKCPTTPKGVAVDANGCCFDTDGDGVKDFADKCPTTPKGAAVDVNGCCLDTDGDGVKDYMDKCPGTMKGVKVTADGCFMSLTLNVNFKTGSDIIEDGYDAEIKAFAGFLNENKDMKVEIQGHTDNRGNDAYNKKLSQRRADAVVRELVKKYGVGASRLTAVGYGEEMPVVPNDTPENMFKNRRIETVVK